TFRLRTMPRTSARSSAPETSLCTQSPVDHISHTREFRLWKRHRKAPMTTVSEQVGRNTRQPLPPRPPGLRERIHRWIQLDDAPDPTPPLTTAQVLHEEAEAIQGVDPRSQRGEQLYRFLNGLNQSALCLSG